MFATTWEAPRERYPRGAEHRRAAGQAGDAHDLPVVVASRLPEVSACGNIRRYALALACIRHGLSSVHGRGIDLLPSEVTAQFQDSLVRQLDTDELSRAFRVVIHGLVHELASVDKELAERLQDVLTSLSESPL